MRDAFGKAASRAKKLLEPLNDLAISAQVKNLGLYEFSLDELSKFPLRGEPGTAKDLFRSHRGLAALRRLANCPMKGESYPQADIVIGRVSTVQKTDQDLFQRVSVDHLASLSSIEHVLVLTSFEPQKLERP